MPTADLATERLIAPTTHHFLAPTIGFALMYHRANEGNHLYVRSWLKTVAKYEVDLLHRVVAGIGDENIAARVDRNARGTEEPAAERVDRRITAERQYFLYRVVAGISDEDIATAIDRNAVGADSLAEGCRAGLFPVQCFKTRFGNLRILR